MENARGKIKDLGDTKLGTNGSPMAARGLILSEDGATPSGSLFISLLGLFDIIWDKF